MKRKPTNKTYEIDSFEKLVNVLGSDNFESLTVDLILWLGYQVKVFEEFRKLHPKWAKDKTNWQIANSFFIWTDDGKHEKTSVTVKNTLTGEIKVFDLKPKKVK